MIDSSESSVRDPEYGKRLERLRARVAENSGRRVAVVIGSSRVAMGVRPSAWEETQAVESAPLLFNMGRLGGGPLFELMTLRRILMDGLRPDVMLIEYWPPLLCEEGEFNEVVRIQGNRLANADVPFLRDYHPDSRNIERKMRAARLNGVYEFRERWLAEIAPSWVPSTRRVEPGCRGLDQWGWVPGLAEDAMLRQSRLVHFERTYRTHFGNYYVSSSADRALRECVGLARANGLHVAFLFMPESSELREWYSPEAERIATEYLNGLTRELNVPLIDMRCVAADDRLVDGIHLSPDGASDFTRSLGWQLLEMDWHSPPPVR